MLMIIVRFPGCLLLGRAEIKMERTLFEPAPVMTALIAGALMWLYFVATSSFNQIEYGIQYEKVSVRVSGVLVVYRMCE